jgi:hypothetical protein
VLNRFELVLNFFYHILIGSIFVRILIMSCLYGSVFIKKKDYMSKFRLFIIFILYDRPLIIICFLTCIIVGTRVRNNKVNFAMISNFFID